MNRIYTSYDQLPLYLTVEEVGQLLGISRANAYTLAHSKGFPVVQIGRRMVVPKDDLLSWLDDQYVNQ